ncbi:sulfotransferase [Thermodesulfatator indicus DSM 15286]|uniref:Sulfotransferase n=2 Tax=Thermodesulfatator indicus TaxID=171695 RepID=F8AC58_THEID|nr:sulfotransferase [Thermodesulfatator indicus DSM 15286]
MLPNFIIAGAAKSGSSTLYFYLGRHPEILMSKEKEPAYFTKYWGKKDLKWYESQFDHWNGEKAIGEATVEYMVDEHASERIYKVITNVKLIFIMRNPVDRAWSHYWHRVKMGEETRSFEDVIRSVKDGNLNEYIVRYGMYATHIRRFLKFFPKTQMKFIILEEFSKEPSKFFGEIFRFLGVDDSFNIEYVEKKNAAKIYKFKWLNLLWAKIRTMDRLKENLPKVIYRPLRKGFRFIDNLNKKPFILPKMSVKDRYFLKNVFQEEINSLEIIIGKSLELWK